jgi:hypothetical protein
LSSTPLSTAPPEPASRADAKALRHAEDPRVKCYRSHFADLMEMRASDDTVALYLDRHERWFRRCAAPMAVTPLGSNGYSLRLGRFGNFGFEVEPTIGLELLPQSQGVYRILTVPAAGGSGSMESLYDVDFKASLRLDSGDGEADTGVASDSNPGAGADGQPTTQVRWELDLSVWIRLPGVITLLPEGLVQSSGEHLLRQIVRQISRRLTWKVQEDFHASHGLDCPPRRRAQF